MVQINFDKVTYYFDLNNFNNENILNFKNGAILISLILNSKVTGKSVKYTANKTDLKNGLILDLGTGFNIPIKSMFFKDNAVKLKGIYSFSMSTSLFCNGLKYKTCNAYDKENNINYCYGCNFESCRTNRFKINSIESNFISGFIFRHAKIDLIAKYINLKDLQIIRFNNHGSFIDRNSLWDFYLLTVYCKNTLFYGYIEYFDYANRLKSMQTAGYIAKYQNNMVINGSDFLIDNNFRITTSLSEYYHAKNRCLSDCLNCMHCLKVLNQTNTNLLHGLLKDIDHAFNTVENTAFIESFFDFKYKINDFKGKYFFYRIKNMLKQINNDFGICSDLSAVKNYKDLVFYLENTYL